MLHLSGDVQ